MKRGTLLIALVILALVLTIGLIFGVGFTRLAMLERETVPPPDAAAPPGVTHVATTPVVSAPSPSTVPSAVAATLSNPVTAPPQVPAPAPPELTRPLSTITLGADTAKLVGESLRLEKHGETNIGFWYGASDSAEWEVQTPRTDLYKIEVIYSCDASNGGGVFQMRIGDHRFTGTSQPTGGWEQYRKLDVGNLTLREGNHHIVLSPAMLEKGRGLMNLRSIRVIPLHPTAAADQG